MRLSLYKRPKMKLLRLGASFTKEEWNAMGKPTRVLIFAHGKNGLKFTPVDPSADAGFKLTLFPDSPKRIYAGVVEHHHPDQIGLRFKPPAPVSIIVDTGGQVTSKDSSIIVDGLPRGFRLHPGRGGKWGGSGKTPKKVKGTIKRVSAVKELLNKPAPWEQSDERLRGGSIASFAGVTLPGLLEALDVLNDAQSQGATIERDPLGQFFCVGVFRKK